MKKRNGKRGREKRQLARGKDNVDNIPSPFAQSFLPKGRTSQISLVSWGTNAVISGGATVRYGAEILSVNHDEFNSTGGTGVRSVNKDCRIQLQQYIGPDLRSQFEYFRIDCIEHWVSPVQVAGGNFLFQVFSSVDYQPEWKPDPNTNEPKVPAGIDWVDGRSNVRLSTLTPATPMVKVVSYKPAVISNWNSGSGDNPKQNAPYAGLRTGEWFGVVDHEDLNFGCALLGIMSINGPDIPNPKVLVQTRVKISLKGRQNID